MLKELKGRFESDYLNSQSVVIKAKRFKNQVMRALRRIKLY
jgi:hypothetical protein